MIYDIIIVFLFLYLCCLPSLSHLTTSVKNCPTMFLRPRCTIPNTDTHYTELETGRGIVRIGRPEFRIIIVSYSTNVQTYIRTNWRATCLLHDYLVEGLRCKFSQTLTAGLPSFLPSLHACTPAQPPSFSIFFLIFLLPPFFSGNLTIYQQATTTSPTSVGQMTFTLSLSMEPSHRLFLPRLQ